MFATEWFALPSSRVITLTLLHFVWQAALAAALLWVWPPFFVYWTTKERGFYGVGLVCGLAVLWLALRLRERDSRLDAALLGFAFGFGVWATQQSLLLSVPALAWLA